MPHLTLYFYAFLAASFILFLILLVKYRKQAQLLSTTANNLSDLLDLAPIAYFYQSTHDKKPLFTCSRQLCLLLNIIDSHADFATLLSKMDEKTAENLQSAYALLQSTGNPFDIAGQNKDGTIFMHFSGRYLNYPQPLYIIWIENITRHMLENNKNITKCQHLEKQRDIMAKTLNILPFPLVLQDKNTTPCFANTTYSALTNAADLYWHSHPLTLSDNSAYTLQYGQDKASEKALSHLLQDYEKVSLNLLKQLPYGIALFDNMAKLSYFNAQFATMWQIEPYYLKKSPYFADILDKIQEKGLLPHVKDFAKYKLGQINLFTQLSKTNQDFIYLQNGDIIQRKMLPFAKGAVLILDEKTQKNTPFPPKS